MNIKVAPCSRKDIWTYVKEIRKNLGIEDQMFFDIVSFLELIMPKIMTDFSLEIVPDLELTAAYAETYPQDHTIRVSESTYNGACIGNCRDRFTLAHELGHLLMHDQDMCRYQKCNSYRIKAYENAEWQANVFAAELLAPSYLIENLTIEDISSNCKISFECAKNQLDNIKKEKR